MRNNEGFEDVRGQKSGVSIDICVSVIFFFFFFFFFFF